MRGVSRLCRRLRSEQLNNADLGGRHNSGCMGGRVDEWHGRHFVYSRRNQGDVDARTAGTRCPQSVAGTLRPTRELRTGRTATAAREKFLDREVLVRSDTEHERSAHRWKCGKGAQTQSDQLEEPSHLPLLYSTVRETPLRKRRALRLGRYTRPSLNAAHGGGSAQKALARAIRTTASPRRRE